MNAARRLPTRQSTLDDLARRSSRALAKLYANGQVPSDWSSLDGPRVGRMLAVRGTFLLARKLRAWAGSADFVWGGKTFIDSGGTGSRGINRVDLGRGGRHALFPFDTRVGASVVDGEPCVILDYDLPENPAFIRKIHDEVREIEPGLWLGPAMWKTDKAPVHVLWFALDRPA